MRLLQKHGITAIADVRSSPYSLHNPQFNREELRGALKNAGILYVFLGKELGARSGDECCYVNDKVQYALLAKTPLFQFGIGEVINEARSQKISLMCAEKDPLDCHRTILVARELILRGYSVTHILPNGLLEPHSDALSRLVKRLGISEDDMFRSQALTIDAAYEAQGERIAYDRKVPRRARSERLAVRFTEGDRS